MATRLYLRQTTANVAGYAITTKSTALPSGTLNNVGNLNTDLSISIGASQVTNANNTLAQSTAQSLYAGKMISDVISSGNITAQTWTVAFANAENNINANARAAH